MTLCSLFADREGSAGAARSGGKTKAAAGRRKPAFDETEEEPYQPRQQEIGELVLVSALFCCVHRDIIIFVTDNKFWVFCLNIVLAA